MAHRAESVAMAIMRSHIYKIISECRINYNKVLYIQILNKIMTILLAFTLYWKTARTLIHRYFNTLRCKWNKEKKDLKRKTNRSKIFFFTILIRDFIPGAIHYFVKRHNKLSSNHGRLYTWLQLNVYAFRWPSFTIPDSISEKMTQCYTVLIDIVFIFKLFFHQLLIYENINKLSLCLGVPNHQGSPMNASILADHCPNIFLVCLLRKRI